MHHREGGKKIFNSPNGKMLIVSSGSFKNLWPLVFPLKFSKEPNEGIFLLPFHLFGLLFGNFRL